MLTPAAAPQALNRAVPQANGKLSLPGLAAAVEVYRDPWGIPHIRAANTADAFFAQGFVTAQDRLWQMEYDRRRGSGRWAEVIGPAGVEQDLLMRRFRLESAARADYQASRRRHPRPARCLRPRGQCLDRLCGRIRWPAGGICYCRHFPGTLAALGRLDRFQGAAHPDGRIRIQTLAGAAGKAVGAGKGGPVIPRLYPRPTANPAAGDALRRPDGGCAGGTEPGGRRPE